MTIFTTVAIIGGGPAGLMAADVLARAGVKVALFDAMPSVGRKFLLAGVGGMNITHAEPFNDFVNRYREKAQTLEPWLKAFGAEQLRAFIHDLGIDTFVGSSGRVFPTDMKAAPLLRAWLKRLREQGVEIYTRHRWQGFDEQGALLLNTPDGLKTLNAEATLLALGGGSWARLGSDGAWQPWLAARGVKLHALKPANCGFESRFSAHLKDKFAGAPLKTVAAWSATGAPRLGECVLTEHGLEGSLIYALSAELRQDLEQHGTAQLGMDLLPHMPLEKVIERLSKPRGARSMAKHLHSQLGLDGVKAALLREFTDKAVFADIQALAQAIKALAIALHATRPLDEAISSAGGVAFDAVDEQLMLKALPGVFVAGEMLDWEAPTGGYLLTACFSSAYQAAQGILTFLKRA